MASNTRKYCTNELDNDRPLRLEHRFLLLRKLGQGTYGKVQLALNKETNEEVAVKTIKKAKIENEEDMLRIRREIHIMSSLQHPHIIHIHEVFETKQKIVIVMQYASGGELYDYLGCHQTLPEDEARRIFRQIASAVYYCHKNQICHRDLKLENILLDEEGNAKIADFGLSNIFDDKRRMNTFCGSPLYASPEIVKGTPYKGPEVDCWSLGVLLYTLVYGTMPFDGRSFKELVSQISEGRYEEPIYRSNASSLIHWLLTPDITQRATIEDVCKDSWINEGYDTPLLQEAENMSLSRGIQKEKLNVTKVCQEKNSKNDEEKSIFKRAATQLEEKAGKFTSILTKNFENIVKTNESIAHKRKPNFYEQIVNYDVRFVLNKIITSVEASLKADKLFNNLISSRSNMTSICNAQKKDENTAEKIDSAYIIPIFEVTSVIPKEREKNLVYAGKNSESNGIFSEIATRPGIRKSLQENCNQRARDQELFPENSKSTLTISQNGGKIMSTPENKYKGPISTNTNSYDGSLLKNCQKPIYSLNISGQPHPSKKDFQTQNQHENSPSRHPSQKNKFRNENHPFGTKQPNPFLRTKNHVLSLARLLSLNYEKIIRNSFRVPSSKKKLPGKITIPPTFNPNNPHTTSKCHEEKKELLIFPTVSVSENKEKIQKKIEKIKKAALNKNLIIRSDSKTRMRIENYIRSQVKRIQDLVREEQRSLQASLEHLDEQSLRDISEMYYCNYGSENTDSGIANTEDEEYFCFLCSKPNIEKGITGTLESFILESIKKGCLYTSNHLHIPRAKEHDKWSYSLNSINLEYGSLNRCKSEIHFPHEYLNYISPNNKSDLSKKTSPKQVIQRNDIGNTKCFSTVSSTTTPNNSDLRLLRSASDSAGLHLSKNTFDVVKLNIECHKNVAENYNLFPHFLQQTQSIGGRYFETTDYETQSTATDATFMNKSQILDKDDGIGDSNESFQSYIDTLENFETDSAITRSMSSHSYTNFTKDNSSAYQLSLKKFLNKSQFRKEHGSECDELERKITGQEKSITDILDSDSWIGTLDVEGTYSQHREKRKGLRRRNTMSCLRRKNEEENMNLENSCTEFENYLWKAYKEHLLESNQNDIEYYSSPNLNFYSLDRKAKFETRDSKSMDYINGDTSNDFMLKEFSHHTYPNEESGGLSSPYKTILKHSNITRNRPGRSGSRLNRTKSLCAETLKDSDRDDIIQRIRQERKFSHCDTKFDSKAPFTSNYLNDFEKSDGRRKKNVGSNRRRLSISNVSKSKQNKSEYKKSFLQLLALKRIEEAEKELKELDKNSNKHLLSNEEDNSDSLLEALKTHGYKNVISQRFQDTDDDILDTFHVNYLKSQRKLRTELARLNYMYYESLPRYNLGLFDENSYFYDDTDYSRSLLSGLPTTSYYDVPYDYRQQAKPSVCDWLDITQIDEYLNSLRLDTMYTSEESTPTPETRKCCTHWGKENYRSFDDESTSESQDTIADSASNNTFSNCLKNKEVLASNESNPTNNDRFQANSSYSDDERQESVHDRIWRKSFYSRFNNRVLSRKERLSFIEPELSESRLGFLNNRYSSPLKSRYDKSELLQRDGSNKSFHTKQSQKHSPSFDKFESRGSVKKKSSKAVPEKETVLENGESCSNKTLKKSYSTCENKEPEH